MPASARRAPDPGRRLSPGREVQRAPSAAVPWLLDFCPSEYRLYDGWRRQPVALAWVTTRHIDAQLVAMRQAYREVRVELGDHLTTDGLAQVLADLEAEGVRLLAARRSAGLVYDALQGKRYVPRL